MNSFKEKYIHFNNIFYDQADFMKAGELFVADHEHEAPIEEQLLAVRLVNEEFAEFVDESQSKTESLKEAIDLIYVTTQYLNSIIGPDKASALWKAVHENNMSKCIDGKLVKRDDGKVIKPDGYKSLCAEDIAEVIGW